MAIIHTKSSGRLAAASVLAPERYDPRRKLAGVDARSVRLGDVAELIRNVVQPADELGPCLVLDTSDAREGILVSRKPLVAGNQIGSAKKVVEPHDVIISRLRPYLRQVAYVDAGLPHCGAATIVCSTEFHVLRARDPRSIAFLVPFLLCGPVQSVLCASQEGGHHPRFDDETLLTLPLPKPFLNQRDEISQSVEGAVRLYRKSEREVANTISQAESSFSAGSLG